MLQTCGPGELLPAKDGQVRLRQRALPPPQVNAEGNGHQHFNTCYIKGFPSVRSGYVRLKSSTGK